MLVCYNLIVLKKQVILALELRKCGYDLQGIFNHLKKYATNENGKNKYRYFVKIIYPFNTKLFYF